MIASVAGLCSLGALAKYPLAHPERAFRQFNALVFASDEEANHTEVHQGDFAEVEYFAGVPVLHCLSNAIDTIRLNASDQPEIRDAAIGILFQPEHFMLMPRQ
jgi:hypothetical protein